jgi:NADPH:quinone reductase-like Zn-dependent oxidoreductase
MKAVRFHEYGGPEVLRYEDAPEPEIGPGQALVRVRACALNRLDLWQRKGLRRVRFPMPHISGTDISGEVVAIDGGDLTPGRRVMLQPGLSCGQCAACLSGQDNHCPHYDLLGYRSLDGGYAEYVKVPVQNLIALPDDVDLLAAAAFPLTFVTAWHMLVTKARVLAGEDVLVLAAGSGIGQAAIQVARLHGARVFTTVGTDAKAAKALELGAQAVINHRTQDFADEIKRLTDRRGVDIVIEHVGEATWEKSLRSLAPFGRLVTCGATTGPAGKIDIQFLFARQLSVAGSYMGTKGELLRAVRFFGSGQLKPVIDRIYPLRDAAAAQQRLEAGEHFGKIVLQC